MVMRGVREAQNLWCMWCNLCLCICRNWVSSHLWTSSSCRLSSPSLGEGGFPAASGPIITLWSPGAGNSVVVVSSVNPESYPQSFSWGVHASRWRSCLIRMPWFRRLTGARPSWLRVSYNGPKLHGKSSKSSLSIRTSAFSRRTREPRSN